MKARRLFARLAAMDRDELQFRAASLARRKVGRLAFAARRPSWRRQSLASAISPRDAVLGPAHPFLARGDWDGAHRALMRGIADGPHRFVLDPSRKDVLVDTVRSAFPTAISDAAARADRVIAGRFDLLGYKGLAFAAGGGEIDWHFDPAHDVRAPGGYWDEVPFLERACGDHKIIWELNRHQYWMVLGRAYWLTGNDRARDTFISHLNGWMAANPPLDGINWASMLELSLRTLSWLWALHFFSAGSAERPSDESPWTVDLLLGLDRQLTLVERNLSQYFSPNTHLLGEALGLYVAGRSLPGLARAARWEAAGRQVLIDQISRQINPDGGHAELSTHYHRYTLDFYLLALATAVRTGDPCADVFGRATRALAEFARAMATDDGRIPAIGDEDGGMLLPMCGRDPADLSDSLQLAAHLLGDPSLSVGAPAEEVVWVAGALPRVPPVPHAWPSLPLRATGYFVSRTNLGDHLIIDGGRHGFLNGGHAHADALALTLTVQSRPLLIDPGVGCYTINPEVRDRFRSTKFHNTLTVDDRSQSIPDGPFHWRHTATATVVDWQSSEGADYFEGSHDGYLPVVHHRAVLSRPGCWIVVDRIVEHGDHGGRGRHRVDNHWHLHPSWTAASAGSGAVRLTHEDGRNAWLVCPDADVEVELFRGQEMDPRLGWCSPAYGPLLPTWSIRVGGWVVAPASRVFVIVDSPRRPVVELISCEPQHSIAGEVEPAIGIRVRTGNVTETVLFTRRGDVPLPVPPPVRRWRAAGIETDARVLCWRDDTEQSRAVLVIDGTMARRVEPDPGAPDTSEQSRADIEREGKHILCAE